MGTIPEFRRVDTLDMKIKLLQDYLEPLFKEYTRRAENNTDLLENIPLTVGIRNDVIHKMGREPRGWYIVRKDGYGDISEVTASTDSEVLSLITTASITVSILVF